MRITITHGITTLESAGTLRPGIVRCTAKLTPGKRTPLGGAA